MSKQKTRPEGAFFVAEAKPLSAQRLHHRVAHLRGAHFGGAFAVDVGGTQALGQHSFHSGFDAVSRCSLVQAETQHHGGAQDGGQGVGHAFARDVGGAAVAGFVQALVL